MVCDDCRKIISEAIEISSKKNIELEKAMKMVDDIPANCGECFYFDPLDPFSSMCLLKEEIMRPARFQLNQNLRVFVERECPHAIKLKPGERVGVSIMKEKRGKMF